MKKFGLLILLTFLFNYSFSQDTLPRFTTRVLGNSKAQISWTNTYGNACTQISVQRSYDSLRFFQTIFSSLSPKLPQNGFVDNDFMPQLKIYYRIFYVLDDGKFFFTKSQTAKIFNSTITSTIKDSSSSQWVTTNTFDSTTTFTYDSSGKKVDYKFLNVPKNNVVVTPKKIYSVYKRKTTHLAYVIDEANFIKFKDSIDTKTKDTLLLLDNEIVLWNPYTPPPAWKPSLTIFTNVKGNVDLFFKDYKTKKYKVVFYDSNNKELFKIKQIDYPKLTLEKANFIKAGWYFFELYEDDKLIEKNKFLLESDF